MARIERGTVWIVDLGLVAKVRPCLVLSVPAELSDRALVTVVPRTTSVRGSRFEVTISAKSLHADGVFDAQQIVTIPESKLMRRLGRLCAVQTALVEAAVRRWLGL